MPDRATPRRAPPAQSRDPDRWATTPTTPDPPAARGVARSWLFAITVLVVVNLLVRQVDDPLRQLGAYLGLMGLAMFAGRVRPILPTAQGMAIALAGLWVFVMNHGALTEGRLHPGAAIAQSVHLATGLGTDDNGGLRVGAILRHLDNAAVLGSYARYADKVDARSSEINILASHLASVCESNDHLCEAASILRFVADEVQYRADPRGGDDYVKSPQETLAANAGDCEDKSILLVSLLEALGNRTWLVFTDDHVWPLVCFDRTLPALWEDRAARRPAGWRARYLEALAPHHDGEELLRLLAAAREIPLDGKLCYAMEPTAPGSFLGVDHAVTTGPGRRVVAVDPLGRRLVELDAGGARTTD